MRMSIIEYLATLKCLAVQVKLFGPPIYLVYFPEKIVPFRIFFGEWGGFEVIVRNRVNPIVNRVNMDPVFLF